MYIYMCVYIYIYVYICVYIYNYIYTADYDIWLYMSMYWNFGIGCWNKCIEIHQPKTNEEMETYENDGSFYPLGTDTYLCGHVHGGFPGPVAPHGLAGYKAIAIWGSIITIKWYISVPWFSWYYFLGSWYTSWVLRPGFVGIWKSLWAQDCWPP